MSFLVLFKGKKKKNLKWNQQWQSNHRRNGMNAGRAQDSSVSPIWLSHNLGSQLYTEMLICSYVQINFITQFFPILVMLFCTLLFSTCVYTYLCLIIGYFISYFTTMISLSCKGRNSNNHAPSMTLRSIGHTTYLWNSLSLSMFINTSL